VNGTLGRYASGFGGRIHLIQRVEDVAKLEVGNPEELAFVTQTTLSKDDTAQIIQALQRRFPHIAGPRKDDICYATQNRQTAVHRLTGKVDLLLVVGSRNSSNSNRLREVGAQGGLQSHLVEDADALDCAWFRPGLRVGVTAGASAPEVLVLDVVERLRSFADIHITEMIAEPETIVFPLPATLTARLAEKRPQSSAGK
jgi:4-hydroxy-3-methylbut-2-enyl diphosphate reductase